MSFVSSRILLQSFLTSQLTFPTSSKACASQSAMSLPNINVFPLRLTNIFFIIINPSLPQVALFLLDHPLANVLFT